MFYLYLWSVVFTVIFIIFIAAGFHVRGGPKAGEARSCLTAAFIVASITPLLAFGVSGLCGF